MMRKALVFLLVMLFLGSGARVASADALSLEVTTQLREDILLLVDAGDGFPEDRTLFRNEELTFPGLEVGDCLRIWQPNADRPPVRTDCNRPPFKFMVQCNAYSPVVCALIPGRSPSGALDYDNMEVSFRLERAPASSAKACPSLRPSAGRAKVFGVQVNGMRCGRAKSTLGRWRGGGFRPEIGPRGWKCTTTLSGRRTLVYECRKGKRTLGFKRYAV